MKKFLTVLSLIIILSLCFATAVSAAPAYSKISVDGTNKDITLIQGGNDERYNLMISWWGPDGAWDEDSPLTNEHTAGCAYKDDIIRIANVDFGANGAASVTINLSNGDENTNPKIGVFVGGAQIAEITGKYTGDWGVGEDLTADITTDVTGVQTVDLKYLPDSDDMSSGTLFYVSFTEKEPPAVVDLPAPAQEEAPAPAPVAPPTGDASIAVLAVILIAAGVVIFKKRIAVK
jgi:hypothetical protein